MSEAYIQALVHEHPACLPIAEIDPMFSGPVAICTELNTLAGPIDNFMVTPSGLPVLVECKLWRNPEARREVVSQILDYAKETRQRIGTSTGIGVFWAFFLESCVPPRTEY